MKKLFFLFCFVMFASFAGNAQTFLTTTDALEAIKTELEKPVVVSADQHQSIQNETAVKQSAARIMLRLISENGNSQETLDLLLSHAGITRMQLDGSEKNELSTYIKNLVTKV